MNNPRLPLCPLRGVSNAAKKTTSNDRCSPGCGLFDHVEGMCCIKALSMNVRGLLNAVRSVQGSNTEEYEGRFDTVGED